jgi:hypothetical protein
VVGCGIDFCTPDAATSTPAVSAAVSPLTIGVDPF